MLPHVRLAPWRSYLLQERHSAEVRKTDGHNNYGHFFSTKSGQKVALTRCWKVEALAWLAERLWHSTSTEKWDFTKLANCTQEGQQTRTQGTASKSEVASEASTTVPATEADAVPLGTRPLAATREYEPPASTSPPTLSTITDMSRRPWNLIWAQSKLQRQHEEEVSQWSDWSFAFKNFLAFMDCEFLADER